MPPLLRRRVVIPAAVVVVALAAVLAVALASSRTAGCSVPAPTVNLPSELRTLGGFDQPVDPNADPRAILDASVTAASALHPDLAGATAGPAVAVAADPPATYNALVVQLTLPGGGSQGRRIVGLVAWLLDCNGRAHYDDVEDVLRTSPDLVPTQFPNRAAASQLGAGATLRLVYRSSPFEPLWLDPPTGRTVPAGLS